MKICILGWYGTETLGDRAILDGIIKIINSKWTIKRIFLGSLYPFFTERTLIEDKEILRDSFTGQITVFAENNRDELKKAIKLSDFVIMGGGPLYDSKELYMVKTGFRYAKRYNKKRIVLGCGYGPFTNIAMHKVAKEIVLLSDIVIFRDEISKKRALLDIPELNAFHLSDPAILSALYYKQHYRENKRHDEIVVNFRSYFRGMSNNLGLNKMLFEMLISLSKNFNKILLVPMHTFFHGGDDRLFYSDILFDGGFVPDNVEIQHRPQNLYQLYDTFSCAYGCIGMRYHSVVLQTILNGNNIILDYTKPNEGKISGFISELTQKEFYRTRYFNIVDGNIDVDLCIKELKSDGKYDYQSQIDVLLNQYNRVLKDLKDV